MYIKPTQGPNPLFHSKTSAFSPVGIAYDIIYQCPPPIKMREITKSPRPPRDISRNSSSPKVEEVAVKSRIFKKQDFISFVPTGLENRFKSFNPETKKRELCEVLQPNEVHEIYAEGITADSKGEFYLIDLLEEPKPFVIQAAGIGLITTVDPGYLICARGIIGNSLNIGMCHVFPYKLEAGFLNFHEKNLSKGMKNIQYFIVGGRRDGKQINEERMTIMNLQHKYRIMETRVGVDKAKGSEKHYELVLTGDRLYFGAFDFGDGDENSSDVVEVK